MSNLVELQREYDRARRAELEKDEAKAIINTHLELNGGDDVARNVTGPEKRDEELKKIAKDVINEVNASRDGGLTAEDLNPVREEFSTQVVGLRDHFDTKFEELATGQEDAPQALQGVLTKKIDTLVKKFEETTRVMIESVETKLTGEIKALKAKAVEDANAATLSHIKSWFYNDDGSFGGKMENLLIVNMAKQLKTLTGLSQELNGSENNAPLAIASVALETDTPTQTTGQYTGKKKSKKSSTTNTAATTTTKRAKCMATKKGDGKPCEKYAEAGFLTCRYQKHREQEEELREKSGVPRTDSTASIQDTATNVNAQAPPTTTQPSVAPRKSSRLKPPGVNKKRKRGDDEEELEHTDHSPGEIVPDCPACAAGCGELTQPTTGPILNSEQADQRDYDCSFDSPEPEERIPHGLPPPPSPTLNGPLLPSPTSTEGAEQTGFRNHEELMKELERLERLEKSQQSQHGVRMKQPTKPGTSPERFFREAPHRRNAGSNW